MGKRWTLQLIELLLQRPARFCELSRALPDLSERVMSDRLRELAEAGLVAREVDVGPPLSTTYSLTPRGGALAPTIEALRAWAGQGIAPARGVTRRAARGRAEDRAART